jgi:hypothetical protein
MAKTVFDVLEEKYKKSIEDQKIFLGGGGAKDYAAYKEVCGVIRGLTLALQDLKDLAQNYMDQDDD